MSPEGVFGLKGSFTPEEEGEYLTMTIGVHNNHAFLITDLEKAAKIYEALIVVQDSQNQLIFYVMQKVAQTGKQR